jgi:hypothetical protein
MKHKLVQFSGMFSLGVSTFAAIPQIIRMFPVLSEGFGFMAMLGAALVLAIVVYGIWTHMSTGSPETMIKILLVLFAVLTPIGFGIILGAT